MKKVTMRELLEAGVHFGHQTRYWHPGMAPYIYGHRSRVHIINLEKTMPMLEGAMNYLSSMAAASGKVLFVGTKRAAREAVESAAQRCFMPYVSQRWLGGMLTNFKTIRNSVKRMLDIEEMDRDGRMARLAKKERLSLRREAQKLKKSLDGIRDMDYLPDALFVIDVGYEGIAVSEARKLGIPVVGIVDTNNDIDGIDYIVPGNDDAIRAITLFADAAAAAILNGRKSVAMKRGDDESEQAARDEPTTKITKKRTGGLDRSAVIRIPPSAQKSDKIKAEQAREKAKADKARAAEKARAEKAKTEKAIAAEKTKAKAETEKAIAETKAGKAAEPAMGAEEGKADRPDIKQTAAKTVADKADDGHKADQAAAPAAVKPAAATATETAARKKAVAEPPKDGGETEEAVATKKQIAAAKKTATKKAAKKKTATAKKAPAVTKKTAAKKAVTKTAAAKKAVTKKTAAKKKTATKKAPVATKKKAATKKAVTKKTAAKKKAAKKAPAATKKKTVK